MQRLVLRRFGQDRFHCM